MPASAHDVLRELQGRLGYLPEVKAQKLLYFVQGWYLALEGRPLFNEEIQAWEMGPVVADVWHDRDKARRIPDARPLDDAATMIVDYVTNRYGHLTGTDLMHLTHEQQPWKAAWSRGRNNQIRNEDLASHFTQDEEFVQHRTEVARLAERSDIFDLDPSPFPAETAALIAAVVAGQHINDQRP